MKIDQLLDKIKENGLSMPGRGTGVNGRILAKDLETTLGDYFLTIKYKDPAPLKHLSMRRSCQPMKAYRYTNLSVANKEELWKDNNEWILEEKYNGWRMMITFVPGDGFMFWGGNISDIDFLPVDYTNHVRLGEYREYPRNEVFHLNYNVPFILDSEAICNESVEMLDGRWSNNTLDAVKAILGSGAERAKALQYDEALLEFNIFDIITWDAHDDRLSTANRSTLKDRLAVLNDYYATLKTVTNFHITKQINVNKKQVLNNLWKKGKEGAILKNINSTYAPGSRKKEIAVKVKRTMSGEIGDDIDAFIIGSVETKEWSKKNLIGAIKLGVFIGSGGERKIHHIATVSAMPDNIREALTFCTYGLPTIKPEYLNKVLIVDGQELSAKNSMILHATVDWSRGFRLTKNAEDCLFDFGNINQERF